MTPHCGYCGERLTIGQSALSESEQRECALGGPEDKVNIIVLQCIKGAAQYYGVNDWISLVDSSLNYSENLNLMVSFGEETYQRKRHAADGGVQFVFRCSDCSEYYPGMSEFLDHAEAEHDRERQPALRDADILNPEDVPEGVEFASALEDNL